MKKTLLAIAAGLLLAACMHPGHHGGTGGPNCPNHQGCNCQGRQQPECPKQADCPKKADCPTKQADSPQQPECPQHHQQEPAK